MKAVILDADKKEAVVLSDDGMITSIRNRGYEPGQSIEIEETNRMTGRNKTRNLVAGIAAAFLISAGGGSTYAYNNPVAEISVDVNPSIVYTVNTFDRVIKARPAGEDAKPILEIIDWDGKDLGTVLSSTIEALKKENFLGDDDWYEKGIVIGVHAFSEKKEDKLVKAIADQLENIVFEETGEDINLDSIEGPVIGIGKERVLEAARLSEKYGEEITPGKLNLVEKLGKSYETTGENPIDTDEEVLQWLDKPVKEIMAEIKENKSTPPGIDNKSTPPGLENKSTPPGIENKSTPPGLENKEKLKTKEKASN